MKDSLKPGLTHRHIFTIPESKTVPNLYPESDMFREMPVVLATGFMVGLLEWACIELLRPHLDWPAEQSLGTPCRLLPSRRHTARIHRYG